jgi:hypothetical protein
MRTREVPRIVDGYEVTWTPEGPVMEQPNPPSPFSYNYPSSRTYQLAFEAAGDLGSRNTRKTWNPFQHYVRELEVSDAHFLFCTAQFTNDETQLFHSGTVPDAAVGYVGNSVGYGNLEYPIGGLPNLFDANLLDDFVQTGLDEAELRNRAFTGLLPGIRSKLSLPNSVYELKDFKSLPRTLQRISELQKKFVVDLLPRKRKADTLRRILRRIVNRGGASSDAALQLQFNILPLLKDIASLQRSLVDTQKDVNKLLSNEGKRRKSRIEISLQGLLNGRDDHSLPVGWTSQYGTTPDYMIGLARAHRKVRYTVSRCVGEMEYSYTLSEWQRENAAINGLLDAIGVNLNPAILWNAIPWSFVVDWVLGVSQYLNRFSIPALHPTTVIHRWCFSIMFTRVITMSKDVCIHSLHPSYDVPVSTLRETVYKRSTATPDLYAAIQSSGLSLSEISLGAALGGSRLR